MLSNNVCTSSGVMPLFILYVSDAMSKSLSCLMLNPSSTKSFGTLPFTKGGWLNPSCYLKKNVAPMNMKFCRISNKSLIVLEMSKLFTYSFLYNSSNEMSYIGKITRFQPKIHIFTILKITL